MARVVSSRQCGKLNWGQIKLKVLSYILRADFKPGAGMAERIDLKGRGHELEKTGCKKLEKSSGKLLQ